MPPSPPPFTGRRDGRPSPTVSVVIPVRNEESNLPLVLESLPRVDEVIVVDGGSSDETVAVAREVRPDAVLLRQTRTGRGNALVCGFAASTGDIVVTLNADGSTDPGEIPRFVEALRAGAEVAHGSRYRPGGRDLTGRRLERIADAILCWLVNVVFGTRFTDLGSGYNAYWRGVLPSLDLPPPDLAGVPRGRTVRGDGPEIEPLINIRMAAQGVRIVEVASVAYPPMHGTRPRRPVRRAWRAFRTLLAEYRRRRRLGRRTAVPDGRKVRPPAPVAVPNPAGERSTGRHAAPVGMRSNPASRLRMEAPDLPAARRAPTGRRQGYPAPAPWTTPAPGAHRTQDITEYDTGRPPPGVRRSGIYDTGLHHLEPDDLGPHDSGVHRTGVYDTEVRRSGLYDTGVHRVGVYDSGVHRTDVYDSGVHHLPDDAANPLYRQEAPRDVGGGRRRLDARDRNSDGRPDLTVIPGRGTADQIRRGPDRRDPLRRGGRDDLGPDELGPDELGPDDHAAGDDRTGTADPGGQPRPRRRGSTSSL